MPEPGRRHSHDRDRRSPARATEALAERLFKATIDTLEIASVHLGGQLGFYRALADGGDATPGELAARTGTAERYAREWLEQQAVAGFLTVDAPDAAANERRYRLPAAHRAVFVDEEDLSYLTPLATLAIGVLGPMEALLHAYRTGGGVPYEDYGPTCPQPSARSTGRSSSTCSQAGSPRSQASMPACALHRLPASLMSAVARPGRASRSPAPTQK